MERYTGQGSVNGLRSSQWGVCGGGLVITHMNKESGSFHETEMLSALANTSKTWTVALARTVIRGPSKASVPALGWWGKCLKSLLFSLSKKCMYGYFAYMCLLHSLCALGPQRLSTLLRQELQTVVSIHEDNSTLNKGLSSQGP